MRLRSHLVALVLAALVPVLGFSALARFYELCDRVTRALVDVGLPGFDGYQLARHVRESAAASIDLVALTGYGQPDDRRPAMEAGFDAHLVKPVNPDSLLAAVHTAGHSAPGDT